MNFCCVQHLRLHHFTTVLLAALDVQLGQEVRGETTLRTQQSLLCTYMCYNETIPNLQTHWTLGVMWRSLSEIPQRDKAQVIVAWISCQ